MSGGYDAAHSNCMELIALLQTLAAELEAKEIAPADAVVRGAQIADKLEEFNSDLVAL